MPLANEARSIPALPDGLPGRILRMRLLGLLIALALLAAGYFLYRGMGPKSYRLRMSAGDALGHRHKLAEILVAEASGRRLEMQLFPNSGSGEAVSDGASGRLDVALVPAAL